MPFSHHNGSLLRQQPGAVLDLKVVSDLKDLCSILTQILHSSQVVTNYGFVLPYDVLRTWGLVCEADVAAV